MGDRLGTIAMGGITGAALGYVASRDTRGVVAAGSLGLGLSMLMKNGSFTAKDPMALIVGLGFAGFGIWHGLQRPAPVEMVAQPQVEPPVQLPAPAEGRRVEMEQDVREEFRLDPGLVAQPMVPA